MFVVCLCGFTKICLNHQIFDYLRKKAQEFFSAFKRKIFLGRCSSVTTS